MKKVIRLTESDLMRIVKRVINEQETGGNITEPAKLDPQIAKYLNTKLAIPAEWVLTTPFNQTASDAIKAGTELSKNSQAKTVLETYKKTKRADYLKAVMTAMTNGTLIIQPHNNGEQVGDYGAKYVPKDSFNFELISCTKEKPCRAEDVLK